MCRSHLIALFFVLIIISVAMCATGHTDTERKCVSGIELCEMTPNLDAPTQSFDSWWIFLLFSSYFYPQRKATSNGLCCVWYEKMSRGQAFSAWCILCTHEIIHLCTMVDWDSASDFILRSVSSKSAVSWKPAESESSMSHDLLNPEQYFSSVYRSLQTAVLTSTDRGINKSKQDLMSPLGL